MASNAKPDFAEKTDIETFLSLYMTKITDSINPHWGHEFLWAMLSDGIINKKAKNTIQGEKNKNDELGVFFNMLYELEPDVFQKFIDLLRRRDMKFIDRHIKEYNAKRTKPKDDAVESDQEGQGNLGTLVVVTGSWELVNPFQLTQLEEAGDYRWMENKLTQINQLRHAGHNPVNKVKVAVIDSKVDANLVRAQVKDARTGLFDKHTVRYENMQNNHGTICAHIIKKYAPFVEIVSYIVVMYSDETNRYFVHSTAVEKALRDIRDNEPDVSIISMSISFGKTVPQIESLLRSLHTEKVLLAAASNDGRRSLNTIRFPAWMKEVIAVGSCDEFGRESAFSPQGDNLDFLMPGDRINQEVIPGIGGGTSFACPCLAATAASLLGVVEAIHGSAARAKLTNTEKMRKMLIPISDVYLKAKTEEEKKSKHEIGWGMPYLEKIDVQYLEHQLARI